MSKFGRFEARWSSNRTKYAAAKKRMQIAATTQPIRPQVGGHVSRYCPPILRHRRWFRVETSALVIVPPPRKWAVSQCALHATRRAPAPTPAPGSRAATAGPHSRGREKRERARRGSTERRLPSTRPSLAPGDG